jgi:hypothetical protein
MELRVRTICTRFVLQPTMMLLREFALLNQTSA